MWVKVCGITDLANCRETVAAGVDAIGLNFYPASRRYVSPETAARLCSALRAEASTAEPPLSTRPRLGLHRYPVDVVGLFVNAPIPQVVQIVEQTGVTAVQFHGDEPADELEEFQQQLPQIPIVRAVRVNRQTLDVALDDWRRLTGHVSQVVCLLDALVDGQFGGTGCRLEPEVVEQFQAEFPEQRLIIAGGLTSDNAASAVRRFRPWGIDTASGVELSPGIKSPEKVRALVQAVRRLE